MITRSLLSSLRTDINEALLAIGKKHGVVLNTGNASFSSNEATFKLQVMLASVEVQAEVQTSGDPKATIAAQAYKDLCTQYGMKPEWLNKPFKAGNKTLYVVGLLPNKHKNNVLVEGTGGGKYIMPPEDVIRYMK